jgi:peptidoglycan/LPS O-acetylase OafA/YrhL
LDKQSEPTARVAAPGLPVPGAGDAPGDTAWRLTSPPARFFGRTPGLDGIRALAVFAVIMYPALLFVLVVSTIYVVRMAQNTHAQVDTVLSSAFYYSNWRIVWGIPGNNDLGHLWSLAIEEQFYLLWPPILIALFALRTRVRVAIGLLVGLIAVLIIHREMLVYGGYSFFNIEVRTDTRIDVLLIGCLAAVLWTYGLTPRRGINIAATISLIGIILAIRNVEPTFHSYELWRILLAIAACIVMFAILRGDWFAIWFFAWRPIRAIGRVSYGLYLWHLPVFIAVQRAKFKWKDYEQILFALAITVAFTLISWYLVERPTLRLKAKLEPRRLTATQVRARASGDDADPDAGDGGDGDDEEQVVIDVRPADAAPGTTGGRDGAATPATASLPPAAGTR